jgi:hypothetical protein
MLLNSGELHGVRLVSRKSVELMTSDAIGRLDLGNYAGDQVLKGYGSGWAFVFAAARVTTGGWAALVTMAGLARSELTSGSIPRNS